MLGYCEMAASYCLHQTLRMQAGKLTNGQASRSKAIVSKLMREVVALARESMGGNGILMEYNIIQNMMDMEALYTYEGTYDINSLISGRELTGGL